MLLESQLICALVENKITLEEINQKRFISDFMPILGGLWDWILEYKRDNNQFPSYELIQTKSSVFQPVEVKDNPLEIISALKEKHAGNYFEQALVKAQRLYRKTANLENAIQYLDNKLTHIDSTDDEDVFELTSPDFIVGEKDYSERRKAVEGQGYYGIPTGFGPELDGFLNGGWLKGNLYGIIGKTGVGKSWLAMAACRGALLRGKTVLYVALEGTVAKEYYRFLTMIVEEAQNTKLQSGAFQLDEFKFYQNQMREYVLSSGGKFYLGIFGKKHKYTPRILNNRIERYKPDLVIVDQPTLMDDGNSKEDWKSFMNVTKQAKIASVRYDIPIIEIIQGKVSSTNDKIFLEDVGQSKGMAQDFDEMFGVSRAPNKHNVIRINSAKVRDNEGDFDAYYQTGWNSGKLKWLQDASTDDGDF